MERSAQDRRRASHLPRPERELSPEDSAGPQPVDRGPIPESEQRGAADPPRPGEAVAEPSHAIEPPAVPDGTFLKVRPEDHPLPGACEVTVYFQDYHRSSSKLGRFGKIVGMDVEVGEYLVMLDNFECVSAPMRRVEWRKVAT